MLETDECRIRKKEIRSRAGHGRFGCSSNVIQSLFLCSDLDLMEFSEPGISNYSTLLLSEKRDALYVGAREAIFELSKKNVTVRNNKVSKTNTICDKRR